MPIMRVTPSRGVMSALCRDRRTVVMPNPRSPKGAGFDLLVGLSVSSAMGPHAGTRI